MEGIEKQIDRILRQLENLRDKSKYDDFSDISREEAYEFVTNALATINRITESTNTYRDIAKDTFDRYSGPNITFAIPQIGGVVRSLKNAVSEGYLTSYQKLIKADTFSNFLEMAEYLLEEGYKDPAAVLIGGVLEENLRLLCEINGISIETRKGDLIKLKNANMMNQELGKAEVYNKLDQKNVTAWQDLRNKAAHGNYDQYTEDQVKNMLLSVREFLSRNMS